MNLGKTKIMNAYNTQVILDNINMEIVDEYVLGQKKWMNTYLGQKIKFGSENQTIEVERRVRLA